MNLSVIFLDHPQFSVITGGECAVTDVNIELDKNLPYEMLVERVFHAIIEVYCPFLNHDKVEELTGLLMEGLECLQTTS